MRIFYAYESLEIIKGETLMNNDRVPKSLNFPCSTSIKNTGCLIRRKIQFFNLFSFVFHSNMVTW